MIFLTVGTQLSFDRLVRAVDQWAGKRQRSDLFGQICDPGDQGYHPTHFEWTRFLSPTEFEARFEAASCIVAHAGMGTIISSLSQMKPLLIMPRRADLKEQRNDHQLATAKQFGSKPGVFVAQNAQDVGAALDALVDASSQKMIPISPFADERLISTVRSEILKAGRK